MKKWIITLGMLAIGLSTLSTFQSGYEVRGVIYVKSCNKCSGIKTIEGYKCKVENQRSDSGHCTECGYDYYIEE